MNACPATPLGTALPALLAAGEQRLSADEIYPRLFDAILEQRLPPGASAAAPGRRRSAGLHPLFLPPKPPGVCRGCLETATNARIISTHCRRVLTPPRLPEVWERLDTRALSTSAFLLKTGALQ